ncbi:MAG: hypothetical protein ACOX87_04665 [Chloroflexota bacterium]|jgi:sulfur relay protein TusB/DsrH
MKILHIIRKLDDQRALATARTHALEYPTAILLIQDAVLTRIDDFPGAIYACAEDVAARTPIGGYDEMDYDRIVQLLFEYDKVISW